MPIVFLLYWYVFNKDIKTRNLFILATSYFFYGCWDVKFLGLIALSTIVDFIIAKQLGQSNQVKRRKLLLFISLFVNLGMLVLFKYFNFFIDSFNDLSNSLGINSNISSLNLILPVGISFYTFQTLSYTIDVYRKRIVHTNDFIAFAAFVGFFPQLVAGPIERATNLLPQFLKKRKFDNNQAKDGLRQMLWGFFKKMVIADNCAIYVNDIFANYESYSGVTLVLGVIYFAIQIYCDFSGYSDIAIGTARLFGFNLMKNFAFPYFSTSMTNLWSRWHISLSTWTNDYIFRPVMLKVGQKGKSGIIFSLMVTFAILGLWHGANWTFIVFGLLHGIVVSSEYNFQKSLRVLNRKINNKNITNICGWFITISLWLLGCIFFRAESIAHAMNYLNQLFLTLDFSAPEFLTRNIYPFIIILLVVEWFQRTNSHGLEKLPFPVWARYSIYYALIFIIIANHGIEHSFVYFQF